MMSHLSYADDTQLDVALTRIFGMTDWGKVKFLVTRLNFKLYFCHFCHMGIIRDFMTRAD